MSDCCTPGIGFPNAASMQQLATNNSVVWEEICKIQQAILTASSQCQSGGGRMSTIVGGTTPMTFIGGVASITVTSPGANYVQDTPAIAFIPPLHSTAVGATGNIVTNGGNILQIALTNGGTGYQPISSTLHISTASGTGATLLPLINAAGQVVSINIINAGLGYTTQDAIIASRAVAPNPLYTNAVFQIASVGTLGEILAILVRNPGSGYQDSVTTIQIVSTLTPSVPYPLGTGFQANVLTDTSGVINQVIITNTGYGYATMSPYLIITDPGAGATTAVNLIGSTVGSVTVITPGTNYTQSATGIVMNPVTATLPNPPSPSATVTVNVNNNTFGTDPQLYYQVWAGLATNKPILGQLNTVLTYFKSIGYTITIQSNPATGNSIVWQLRW